MTIVRRALICVVLTILFLVEAGKRRLSMTSLYEGFSGVRIALLNPEDGRSSSWFLLDWKPTLVLHSIALVVHLMNRQAHVQPAVIGCMNPWSQRMDSEFAGQDRWLPTVMSIIGNHRLVWMMNTQER